MKQFKVGVVVGSIRQGSYSKMIADALIEVAPKNLDFEFLEIANLALYNQDYDAQSPDLYTEFRTKVSGLDAFVFVTPEHNRSIPAALKNALDVASRPWGQNVWNGKPAGVISSSIGSLAGFGANHHLRQVLSFLNIPTMAQPEAYIGGTMGLFDENGKLTDDSTKQFLINYGQAFAKWVETIVS
ncbi:MAG: NADPH-dependent FMN reductase [Paludibacteraceae bacterium]